MAYTKGSTYIWSDGEQLHLWSEEGLDHWQSIPEYGEKPKGSGVQIPEPVADQFAVMRFAELLKSGEACAVINRTVSQWGGNFGCVALEELAPRLLTFCEAYGT